MSTQKCQEKHQENKTENVPNLIMGGGGLIIIPDYMSLYKVALSCATTITGCIGLPKVVAKIKSCPVWS